MTKKIILLSLLVVLTFAQSCRMSKKKRHTYMENAYTEIKESFPDATTTIVNDSIKIIFPNNIMFETASSDLMSQFSVKLERFSQILSKYDQTKLLVTGHTDSEGNDEDNLTLSKKRADNVKIKLIENKINQERLFTWGLGEKSPISSNETEEGKALNRRVEFVVLFSDK